MRIAFVLTLLIALPAFAEDAKKPDEALEKLFKARLELCVISGENQAGVGYYCPATATATSECKKTLDVSADQALSICVANKLTRDEQAAWKASPLNPVRK